MNKCYRIVWEYRRNMFIVVSERSRGDNQCNHRCRGAFINRRHHDQRRHLPQIKGPGAEKPSS